MIVNISSTPGLVGKIKTTDQSITNSVTLTDETDLQFSIGANEKWIFTWTLLVTFSVTGQLQISVVTPSGATQLITVQSIGTGISPITGNTTTSAGAIALAGTLTSTIVVINAAITNGSTAGTVKIQFAQNVLDVVTATVVKTSSNLRAQRI